MSSDAAIARFQTILRIPTVSRTDATATDWSQFDRFLLRLYDLYPFVHSRMHREVIAGHSVLFRWSGRSSSEPCVLLAHYDVVPATDRGWKHPPFAGELSGSGAEQLIWGRGALDNKGAVASILEAAEFQLMAGLVPAQDIYIALGHDEETAGLGATAMVDLLESRGIRPSMVIDEGGAIVEGVFPGVPGPVAVVGVGEKATATIRLVVEQHGGHASTPPPVTATARLARAIVRLDRRPFRPRFTPTAIAMFRTLGDNATGIVGWAMRNIRFTQLALLPFFARLGDEHNAMVRTTQAVTMLDAGHAVNALADRAVATVNVRIAVGSSIQTTLRHMTRAIHDKRVRIELVDGGQAVPVSLTTGLSWELLRSTIERCYPGVLVTPYVQNGATDSRHFTRISRGVYRFTPFEMSKDERDTLHARDERMHVLTFMRAIEFYKALIAAL